VDANTVVNTVGGRLTVWGVRSDDERFVTRPVEMLDYPEYRVADSVDIREERLRDDCNAHPRRLTAPVVLEVARGDTTREDW
jgi:hypothetical protein